MSSLSQLSIPLCQEVGFIPYLEFVQAQPLLEQAEECALAEATQTQADVEALKKLVRANLRFVVTMVENYASHNVPVERLIDAGNEGLIKAAQKYDYSKEYTFISYAQFWIKTYILQTIVQFIRNWTVKYQGRTPRMPKQDYYLARAKEGDLYSRVLVLKHYLYIPQLLLGEFQHLENVDMAALEKVGKDGLGDLLDSYYTNPFEGTMVKYMLEEHLLYHTLRVMLESIATGK